MKVAMIMLCKPFGIKELCARIECALRKVIKQQGIYL